MRGENFEGVQKNLYGDENILGGGKSIEGVKKFLGSEDKAKKGELRAEKQQVYHMACHGSISCIYTDGA